jgi:type IV secretion system protein TrbI
MENITDPFDPKPPLLAAQTNVQEPPVSAFDENEKTISRGMPKKNFKVFAMLLLAGVLVGAIFWPQDKTGPAKTETTAPEPTNKVAAQGIVDSLAQEQTQPVVPQAGVSNSAFNLPPRQQPGYTPAGGLDPLATSELSPAQKAAMDAQARQEAIIASSMSPGDFTLEQRQRSTSTASSERIQPPGQGLSELLQSQERVLANLGNQQGGSQQQQLAQQTRRDPNSEFLQSAGNQSVGSLDQMIVAPPKYSLFQGTTVRGVLLNGINTEVPGEFRARVVSDIFDSATQRSLIIPRGSILIGAYKSSILVGQSRMVLAAQRLIMPNGKSINLRGSVLGDQAGIAGMPGEVDNHFWQMFKASFIVGAASLLLPRDQQTITTTTGLGGQQTGGTIVAKSLSDVITRIAERNSSIGPTGSVDAGEIFTLMIQRDIAMEPYKW